MTSVHFNTKPMEVGEKKSELFELAMNMPLPFPLCLQLNAC